MIFRVTFDSNKAMDDVAEGDDLGFVVVALVESDDKKSHEQRQKEICEDWVEYGKMRGINPTPGSPKFEEFLCEKRGYKIHTDSAKRLKIGMEKLYAWLKVNLGKKIPDELWEEVRATTDIVSFSVN